MIYEGKLELVKGKYVLTTAPHVRMMIKRVMLGTVSKKDTITINRNPDTTENLLWILERWPHEFGPGLLQAMQIRASANREMRETAAAILAGEIKPPAVEKWNPAFPLRDYQAAAVALAGMKDGFLCGDDIGLGKTATGIGFIATRPLPALVVCQSPLTRQWAEAIKKFCPALSTHIIKQGMPYSLPAHDVTICSYSLLHHWWNARSWQTVVYDEIQELRHRGTDKYNAATAISLLPCKRLGLSATPVVNNAGEIYNVMDALAPGVCGTVAEFEAEWGSCAANKYRVDDPEALGDWLRKQGVYVRRTRKQAGRELPPMHRFTHVVKHDPKILERLRAQANHLAAQVLSGGFHQKGMAARQLDIMLRQTTGIAKAPFVADFVAELVKGGEKVLLGGWHHEVYGIWEREFKAHGITAVRYTGTESNAEKRKTVQRFEKDAQVLIMSLRAGVGLDGLQHHASTVVFGEYDWSPKIMEQFAGRLHRDGQKKQCTAFCLAADSGSDPLISSLLAGKWEQSTAITDPELLKQTTPTEVPASRMAELARHWLDNQ